MIKAMESILVKASHRRRRSTRAELLIEIEDIAATAIGIRQRIVLNTIRRIIEDDRIRNKIEMIRRLL